MLSKNGVIKTNYDRMIGQKYRVTEEINNIEATGAIRVGGVEWSARSKDEGQIIPVDAVVRVESIDGVKAIVSCVSDIESVQR